ncbi:MAG: FAD-dependent oxidoreductase [Lachnospiraceae bacterium]|jgi:2,4-dienoyl-CoA reductase-like NADH-dependent reductase (Old Yellow Enzyme family)/NADPH-dependent 2,4-dienoyl-CoA reductase/sulfur reductase-like enzyme|nr:FAD-dependent oxidoreductase [Lachnospiraceae bacterium]
MAEYKNIFKPCVLSNGTILKNRIIYPNAQQSYVTGAQASPIEAMIEDLADFCRSGASLMNFGHFGSLGGGAAVHTEDEKKKNALVPAPDGYKKEMPQQAPFFDYSDARTFNMVGQIAAVAHMFGTKILVKMANSFPKGVTYDGGDAKTLFPAPVGDDRLAIWREVADIFPHIFPWAVKGSGMSLEQMKARIATKEQIKQSIDDLVSMLANYKQYGWDGVSLRGDRFIDAATNLREDEYGGEVENRGRLLLETFQKIKEVLGEDFLIELVMPGDAPYGHDGQIPHGYSEDEFIRFVKMVEPYIDIIEIRERSGAGYQNHGYNSTLTIHPCLEYAKHLREAGFKGTIAVNGGFHDPDDMEKIIGEGIVDLISAGRPFRAEPKFLEKLRMDGEEIPMPCLRCNKCHGPERGVCGCSVNPKDAMGHRLPSIIPAPIKQKKVAIIGAGPIGLRAACFAAERGHTVTIFEKDNKLGGKVGYYAALYPQKWPMARYLSWLVDELKRRGVKDIRLGTEPNPEDIEKEGFDAVIACTGSHEIAPPIPGADTKGVWLDEDVYFGNVNPGQSVIIVGGGSVATETAMYIASLGKDVTILTRQEVLMKGEFRIRGPHMAFEIIEPELGYGGIGGAWTKYENLKPIYNAQTKNITPTSVTYEKDGGEITLNADTVIVSGGFAPNAKEALRYADCTKEFYIAGDADKNCTSLMEGNRRAYGRVSLL